MEDYPISMITMSEAGFDRIEERHRREKKSLSIAFLIAVAVAAASNIGWLIYFVK